MTSPARAGLTQRSLTNQIQFSFASEDVNEGQSASPPFSPRALFLPGRQPHFLTVEFCC